MRKTFVIFAAAFMVSPASALSDSAYHWTPPKAGQLICNIAFPGSLKVCHPVGTSPAGVIGIGNDMQLVTLPPFSAWTPSRGGKGLTAKGNPKIAVFRGKQVVGLLTHANGLPFFQNISHVAIRDMAGGDHQVIITAWTGGNNADSTETITLHITNTGHITLSH
jgi:hypothetical protein